MAGRLRQLMDGGGDLGGEALGLVEEVGVVCGNGPEDELGYADGAEDTDEFDDLLGAADSKTRARVHVGAEALGES